MCKLTKWCNGGRFFVDDVPIRVFKNCKDLGVKFPFDQPMKIYSSLWNADDWATRGGLEKTDWSKAPFVASYKGFHVDGCESSVQAKFCATQGRRWWDQKSFKTLMGCSTVSSTGFAKNTPFTITAPIGSATQPSHQSASATEIFDSLFFFLLFPVFSYFYFYFSWWGPKNCEIISVFPCDFSCLILSLSASPCSLPSSLSLSPRAFPLSLGICFLFHFLLLYY